METTQQLSLNAIVERDARAGHFIVDILAGADVDQAVEKHFNLDHSSATDESALREAENRGYLKGLNEAAEKKLNAPALYEQLPPRQQPAPEEPDPNRDFFPETRKSVWDD